MSVKNKCRWYKTWNAALVVGSAAVTLVFNGVALSVGLTCHAAHPKCDYQFEAVGLTSTASDTGWVERQPL